MSSQVPVDVQLKLTRVNGELTLIARVTNHSDRVISKIRLFVFFDFRDEGAEQSDLPEFIRLSSDYSSKVAPGDLGPDETANFVMSPQATNRTKNGVASLSPDQFRLEIMEGFPWSILHTAPGSVLVAALSEVV